MENSIIKLETVSYSTKSKIILKLMHYLEVLEIYNLEVYEDSLRLLNTLIAKIPKYFT